MPAITKGAILNVSSNTDVYERGERYYLAGKLISCESAEEVSGETSVRASVEGNYKNYDVMIRLGGEGELSAYACTCESHSIWRGACKHVVAALFALLEGGDTHKFSPEKMSRHAKNLADSLEKIIYDGIDQSLPIIQGVSDYGESMLKLAPVLNFRNTSLFLTFEIGHGRMYVVKNISGFVASCKKGETVSYGQGLTFSHRREMFDENSRGLIDFITREDDMYAEIAKRLSHRFQFTHKPHYGTRELFLTPRNIDEFFEIFLGETLQSVSDFAQFVTLQDGCPPLGLSVRHAEDTTFLQFNRTPHFFFGGDAFFYLISAEGFFRMPKTDGRLLKTLFKTLGDTPEIPFSGDEQNRFVTVILPRLLKMGALNSVEGDCPEVKTPTLSATKIFFDADKNDVTARVEFVYEDEGARDIVAQYALSRRLSAHGFAQESTKDGEIFRLKGGELIFAFLHKPFGMDSLRDIAEIFISDDLQKKAAKPSVPQLGLRLAGNLLNISLENSEYKIGELLEALEAYRERKKFYRLRDGRFISLENEEAGAAAEFLDALGASKKDSSGNGLALPAYRALFAGELAKSVAHTTDENFKKLIENFSDGSTNSAEFKTPKGLGKILREYQKTGYRWLKTLAQYGFGGILADDMGLGKTLQIIALFVSEYTSSKQQARQEAGCGSRAGKKLPSIVIAPTSVLYNWQNEIAKFAPQLTPLVISGLAEKRHELLKTPGIDIFITTYDMLKRDIMFYRDMEFSYVIADEAQNIKNPATQAAKSLKALNGRVRFALTGTPIENTLSELWSIFDFIMPGYLFGASKFLKIYEQPILKTDDKTAAEKLRKQIAPFILRRIKKNVLRELPEKTETTLLADFCDEQKLIYHAHLLQTIGVLDEMAGALNSISILAQLTRLRQICCHPALFLQDYTHGSGKLDLALETIQLSLESGHRVLLFSQFTQMLDIIKEALPKSVSYFYLDGATKSQARVEMAEKFNGGERDLFLISLKAGGTGLNLTGADVVIHYDPWWNPSVMDQAADRAHRFGQKKSVQVFNIVAKDSIEEKIMELQEKKRGLIDSVITEGGSFINALSEEEIRNLLSHG
ncbi:MAG: DEAD/DEAH box helicase [Defluviitaleaceae bacterium]|nr:DEAD/DEAH box helicase [Defluviitaleaceae bacterium]